MIIVLLQYLFFFGLSPKRIAGDIKTVKPKGQIFHIPVTVGLALYHFILLSSTLLQKSSYKTRNFTALSWCMCCLSRTISS